VGGGRHFLFRILSYITCLRATARPPTMSQIRSAHDKTSTTAERERLFAAPTPVGSRRRATQRAKGVCYIYHIPRLNDRAKQCLS